MNSKICVSCGRSFEMRKKWKNCWDQVKYCSKTCQKNKEPTFYKELIINTLNIRRPGTSICPSEILDFDQKQNKELMERVRSAARLLVQDGLIEILQKNKVVNPTNFKGPIRFKLKNNH